MKNFLAVICIILTLSSQTFADDTTPEPCAGGAGFIFVGKITGHKYCISNTQMNWWNAHAWCDALGRKLFSLNECGCSGAIDCKNKCPEIVISLTGYMAWTTTPADGGNWKVIEGYSGYTGYSYIKHQGWHALCK